MTWNGPLQDYGNGGVKWLKTRTNWYNQWYDPRKYVQEREKRKIKSIRDIVRE